jgi:tetratricopeptide (TPR) repeat protein
MQTDNAGEVGGLIARHGLTDWWLATFTPEERERMAARYQPPRPDGVEAPERPLTEGSVTWRVGSPTRFLAGLATWFVGRRDRALARRIVAAAARQPNQSVLDRFWLYQAEIRVYYPDRDADPVAFASAIAACERQIELAPRAAAAFHGLDPEAPLPDHLGYRQLAIIREKQGRYAEAIRLSEAALRQGWAGDWQGRIARIQRRRERRAQRAQRAKAARPA